MEMIRKAIIFPDVPHDGTLGLKLHNMAGEEIFQELTDTTWAEYWDMVTRPWEKSVQEYEDNPGDFHAAWHYLDNHPAFWFFRGGDRSLKPLPLAERLHLRNLEVSNGIHRCVDIRVHKVNPAGNLAEDEDGTDLRTEVWIELGKQSWPVEYNAKDPNTYDATFNDYELSCGGPTVEAAIIRAAYNVWTVYGNDRRVCDAPYNERDYKTVLNAEEFDKLMEDMEDDGEINERVRRAYQRLRETVGALEEE